MLYKRQYRKKQTKKLAKGQVSLIGEIYDYDIKYKPHLATSPTGEAVVVLRLPKEATPLERVSSMDAMREMASNVRIILKSEFWRNKHRDEIRRKELEKIDKVNSTTIID